MTHTKHKRDSDADNVVYLRHSSGHHVKLERILRTEEYFMRIMALVVLSMFM